MDKKKPFFFYTNIEVEHLNKKYTRRACFAGVEHEGKILIGQATCSEKDQFVKAKARLISTGRANTKPIHIIDIKPEPKITKQFVEACNRIIKHT